MQQPLVTIAIPSLNQGIYLAAALESVFAQDVPVEVFVLDAGSTDDSLAVIKKWESRLAWWRSRPDNGQAAAINEGIRKGTAPFVCWLNSDDLFLDHGLTKLVHALQNNPAPAVYGRSWNVDRSGLKLKPYWTAPFSVRHLANRCFISQPATLIRREAWQNLAGLDETLTMAFDYDLWWRLYKRFGPLLYLDAFVAANRRHRDTKTTVNRRQHYREAMALVNRHYGKIPMKWYLARPIMVHLWLLLQKLSRRDNKPVN